MRKRTHEGGGCTENDSAVTAIDLANPENSSEIMQKLEGSDEFKLKVSGTKVFKRNFDKMIGKNNKRKVFLTYQPKLYSFKFEGCPKSKDSSSYPDFDERTTLHMGKDRAITFMLGEQSHEHYTLIPDDDYDAVYTNLTKIKEHLSNISRSTPEVFYRRLKNVIEFVERLQEKEEMTADEKKNCDGAVSALSKIKSHIINNSEKLFEKAVVVGCIAAAGIETVHELMGDIDVPFAAIATGILLVVYNRLQRLGVLSEQIKSSIESVIDRMEYIMKPLKEIKENLTRCNSIKVGENFFEQGSRVFSTQDEKVQYIIWKLQTKIVYILPEIFTMKKEKGTEPEQIIHTLVNEDKKIKLTRYTGDQQKTYWRAEELDNLQYHILTPFYLESNSSRFLVYTNTTNIPQENLTSKRKDFLDNLKKIEIELLNYLVELMEICIKWIKREEDKNTVAKMFSNLGYYEDKINNLSETLNRKVGLFNTTLSLHQYYHLLDIKHQLVSSDIFDPYNMKHILTLVFNTFRPLNQKIDINQSFIEKSLKSSPVAQAVTPIEGQAVTPIEGQAVPSSGSSEKNKTLTWSVDSLQESFFK